MDKTVLRNFQRHLLPLAGTGPLVCLQLGVRNPSHVVWLMENVLACTDDRWFGTDDFRGSYTLFKECVDVLGGFTNATVWPYDELRFLAHMPPKAAAGLSDNAALMYLDSKRDEETMWRLLYAAEELVRPGGLLIINGYRTRRRREPETQGVVNEYLAHANPWDVVWDNTQIGVRRI